MNTPNFNLYPPEGYVYDDPSGTRLDGQTWPDLIARVQAYRQQRGLPPGNALEDVFQQFCIRHPTYCQDQKIAQQFIRLSQSSLGFTSQVESWIADAFTRVNSGKMHYVHEDETQRRVAICIRCPAQTEWRTGCQGCSKNLDALSQEILRKRPPGANSNALRACRVLAEDTRVSTHLNLPGVDNPSLPPECWRLTKA